MEVVRDRFRLDAEHLEVEVAGRRGTRGSLLRVEVAEVCRRGTRSPPRATQKSRFSSAPAATSGTGAVTGSRNGCGA